MLMSLFHLGKKRKKPHRPIPPTSTSILNSSFWRLLSQFAYLRASSLSPPLPLSLQNLSKDVTLLVDI